MNLAELYEKRKRLDDRMTANAREVDHLASEIDDLDTEWWSLFEEITELDELLWNLEHSDDRPK